MTFSKIWARKGLGSSEIGCAALDAVHCRTTQGPKGLVIFLASKKSGRVGTLAAVQGSDQSADSERRSNTRDQSAETLGQIRVSHKPLRLDVSHRELIEAWMLLFSGANPAVDGAEAPADNASAR